MRRIVYFTFIIGSILFSITSCRIDNFPWPDAQVYGAILDSLDGSLVETDLNNGSTIGAYELGKYAANPTKKTWVIKQNGEYRNNLVYSNQYQIEFTSCNFFSFVDTVDIKPGENKIDFTVVPYIRIRDVKIEHDSANNKIVATFRLEPGRPNVKLASITLYAWSDMYVGEYVKKQLNKGTGQPTQSFTPAVTINPSTVYTLSIDLAANQATTKDGFGVHRNYYFRVGAKASSTGLGNVGTVRSNYAPYVVIPL